MALYNTVKENFTSSKYDNAFSYASKHWDELVHRADNVAMNGNAVSIAEQIQHATKVDYNIASDIANSIWISRQASKRYSN